MNWEQFGPIILPLVYCSWLILRPFSSRVSRVVLLLTNLATASFLAVYDVSPVNYVIEDWRLQAIVAFEVVTAVAAVAAFLGNRPALYYSWLAFAIHLGAIVWVLTFPIRFDHVLDYG